MWPFAIGLFGKIAEIWQLSIVEQSALLGMSETEYLALREARHGADVSCDVRQRISYIVNVYKALNILLGSQEAADAWIKRPNNAEPFCGESALSWILDGPKDGIAFLHDYLQAKLGS